MIDVHDDLSIIASSAPPPPGGRKLMERAFADAIDRLEKALSSRKKSQGIRFFECAAFPGLSPMLVRRAEELTRRVWAAGGAGSTQTELGLIRAIAVAADPGALPFFEECLQRRVPREQTGPNRRALAILGVAVVARGGHAAAREDLRTHLGATDAERRGAAVAAVGYAFSGTLPDDLRIELERIARSDTAFAPRFLARGVLVSHGIGPIIDVEQGAYVFTASLRGTRGVSRTVELRATHSLHHLALAVLDAFGWDSDHLYCFYLDGRDRRGPFAIGLDWDFAETGLFASSSAEDAEGETVDAEEMGGGMSAPIGAIGLVKGQRFVFHFDFGDDHLFDITVDQVSERVPRGAKLPRLVARTGRSPSQYRSW